MDLRIYVLFDFIYGFLLPIIVILLDVLWVKIQGNETAATLQIIVFRIEVLALLITKEYFVCKTAKKAANSSYLMSKFAFVFNAIGILIITGLLFNSIGTDFKSNYWLEGIDESQYRDKYNEKLPNYGDYVFKLININDLTYISDIEYGNVHLKANKTYYLVQIYDEAIYYKYITAKDNGNEINYHVYSDFYYKKDSISKEYIFSQNNGGWEIKELIK